MAVNRQARSLVLFVAAAEAHVGSPDAVADGMAGPYHLLVMRRRDPLSTGGGRNGIDSAEHR